MNMVKTPKKNMAKQLAEELDTFDIMLSSLIEILEKKGVLTQEEWENKIKAKIDKRSKSPSLRDIQFGEN